MNHSSVTLLLLLSQGFKKDWACLGNPLGLPRHRGSAVSLMATIHPTPQVPMSESPPLNLPEILASHARFLAGDPSGECTNLIDANLIGASLIGANLKGASLIGANLKGASLIGANLIDANLNGTNLIDANLNGASLIDANLNGASLIGANLKGASLIGANLKGANLNGASLIGASLIGASLIGANLKGASLNGTNLIDANLNGTNLIDANLNGASLIGANLAGASGIAIAADAPQRLMAAAAAALQEGALEMGAWHTYDTTHCLGGWLIHQAGEVGRLLEAAAGPGIAGLMLGGLEAHSHFHDSNEAAAEWLRSVLAQPEMKP